MKPQELELLHLTTALRTQMMDSLTDADLAFHFPSNPTLGQLCREIGNVERSYIDSFKTLKHTWEAMGNMQPELETSVEKLKAWYKALDDEFDALLLAIPDGDLQTKMIDRGGGFILPLGGQFHVYREAVLIHCAKCSVYLRALGKPLSQQWQGWIG